MKLTSESKPMLIAVSSGALFDTQEEEAVVRSSGIEGFYKYREEVGDRPFGRGTAFPLVEALLRMNEREKPPLVKVYIVSHNDPSVCLRVTRSAQHHNLTIERALFCGKADLIPYLKNAQFDLFLSRSMEDVRAALVTGIPAAMVFPPPSQAVSEKGELRIAFDGDAVLFSDEAEKVYQAAKKEADLQKLGARYPVDAFISHEVEKCQILLPEGPFAPFGRAVSTLQKIAAKNGAIKVCVALITARSLPTHERALNSLRCYGIHIDQALFLSGDEKAPFVRAFDPHIFFDDQEIHLVDSSKLSPCALVPGPTAEQFQEERSSVPASTRNPGDTHSTHVDSAARSDGVSLANFEAGCREILIDYVPFAERKRGLPSDFQQLIKSGRSKTAQERSRILKDLERYRLGNDVEGFEPLLNREGSEMLKGLARVFQMPDDSNQGQLF